MKLEYKPIEKNTLDIIYVNRMKQPYLGLNWHFHQEFELIYFLEGQGMRIVGDDISNFNKGELVLVGGWLPHLWRNDCDQYKDNPSDFIVIKFLKEYKGINLFSVPELTKINQLLMKARRGLLFPKKILNQVHDLIIHLSKCNSSEKFFNFIQLLHILSQTDDYKPLASPEFVLPNQTNNENRLQKVINYVFNNYAKTITLEEISGVAFMTPPAFCRFFKNSTNKTFLEFLNEFRVGKSCQLLISGEKNIKQICYEVGFNSLTNFNRVFKSFKGESPTKYRAAFKTIRLQ
ncbi:MAG: AraC family transcriptional regulator [Saprospiraceae bacterium]|nr:AraC family transcriptional regulator [Saprospiraceae bacterium]